MIENYMASKAGNLWREFVFGDGKKLTITLFKSGTIDLYGWIVVGPKSVRYTGKPIYETPEDCAVAAEKFCTENRAYFNI